MIGDKKAITAQSDFKVSLRKMTGRYQILITSFLFVIGISLRIISIYQTGALWSILGEIGTFIAAVIAIPFIYEKLVKTEEKQVFLSDLEDVLENKLSALSNSSNKKLRVVEEGRMAIMQKVEFIKDAKQEIIILATSARSFVYYFESRPYIEFKQPVVDALKRGVNLSVYIFDPDCPNALTYATDRNDTELIPKINSALEGFIKLRDEFMTANYPGKFELFRYSQLPACYMLVVDPQEPQGRMHISHYLHGLKHADTPIIEVYKAENPVLFDKYADYVNRLAATCKKVE
ncbi:MAG: hypothetical protein EHM70_04100 [Chloroflexota bacterium]|nr:MAG: hypothetical protein EHM70_04100 [Chloroflexota bacterium]